MEYARRLNGRFAPVYTEAFRRNVIEEYLRGDVTKMHVQRKYGIKIKTAIHRWMKRYGYRDKEPHLRLTFTPATIHALVGKMNTSKATKKELEEKVRVLERQLEDEKLRSEAYQRMIEKAEKELKVPIRKKSATR